LLVLVNLVVLVVTGCLLFDFRVFGYTLIRDVSQRTRRRRRMPAARLAAETGAAEAAEPESETSPNI
jgi:hypothetical protein